MPIRCEDCEAVLVAGQCVICGWRPRPVRTPRPSPNQVPWEQHSAQIRQQARDMIAEVVSKLGAMEPAAKREQYGPGSAAPAVQEHVRRLRGRGLSEGVAYMQAIGMVQDPAHRRWCEICQRETGQGPK